MLNKPLNVAHAKDRQAQKCIKKGLFDSAVKLEKNIIQNLEEALKESTNPLAVQSIQLQKARHTSTLSRLEKEIEVRDRARKCVIVADTGDMSDIPQFGGKSAPVLSASHLPSNASDKDRMILRLQDKVAILNSQLEQCQRENAQLRERVRELERGQSLSTTQLLSPHSSCYQHITAPNLSPSSTSHILAPTPSSHTTNSAETIAEDTFSLTPLEQPPVVNFKW